SDGAPLKRDDKEHQRGGEEAEDRDGLQDVEEWEHDDGGRLVRGRGGPERDREDEGQQVGEDHPRRREERKEGELDRVERGLRVEDRDDDRGEDHDPREDPKAPAEAAHLARKGRGLYTGSLEGPSTITVSSTDGGKPNMEWLPIAFISRGRSRRSRFPAW